MLCGDRTTAKFPFTTCTRGQNYNRISGVLLEEHTTYRVLLYVEKRRKLMNENVDINLRNEKVVSRPSKVSLAEVLECINNYCFGHSDSKSSGKASWRSGRVRSMGSIPYLSLLPHKI
jgi:hypothetical protein